jgi:hypothetical protein
MRAASAIICCFVVWGLVGCPNNDQALFTTPSDFPDKAYAGRTIFIYDAAAHRRADELRSEIVQADRELMRRVRSAAFDQLSTSERSAYLREGRAELASLTRELRSIIDANQ